MLTGSSSFHACRDLYQCASSDVMMCSSDSESGSLCVMVVTPCVVSAYCNLVIWFVFRSPVHGVKGYLKLIKRNSFFIHKIKYACVTYRVL